MVPTFLFKIFILEPLWKGIYIWAQVQYTDYIPQMFIQDQEEAVGWLVETCGYPAGYKKLDRFFLHNPAREKLGKVLRKYLRRPKRQLA